jgi:hypothetical protein
MPVRVQVHVRCRQGDVRGQEVAPRRSVGQLIGSGPRSPLTRLATLDRSIAR